MYGTLKDRKMAVDHDENMREMYSMTTNNSIDYSDASKKGQHLSDIQNTSKNGKSGRKTGVKRTSSSISTRMYQHIVCLNYFFWFSFFIYYNAPLWAMRSDCVWILLLGYFMNVSNKICLRFYVVSLTSKLSTIALHMCTRTYRKMPYIRRWHDDETWMFNTSVICS